MTSGANYARESEQVISVTAFASGGEYLPSFGPQRERRRSEKRDERCKSFAGVELGRRPMRSSSFVGHDASSPRQLSTRTSLFSTRQVLPLQVRDVDFVRVVHISTYIGTGADSRVPVACPPALMKVVAVPVPTLPLRRSLASLGMLAKQIRSFAFSRPSPSCSRASITS